MRTFRYFQTIRECGSISAAAEQLGISQPALSEFVKRLESDLGAKLVKRTSRGVEFSEAGELFASRSKEILARIEDARAAVQRLGAEGGGQETIGLTSTFSNLLAVPLTETIWHAHGKSRLKIIESSTLEILDHVEKEIFDVGVGYVDFRLGQALYAQPLLEEELFLLAASDDWPVAADERGIALAPVRLADLREKTLILPPPASVWRRSIDRFAEGVGVRLNPAVEIYSMQSVLSLVRRASAYTIAPQSLALREIARGEVICVPFAEAGMSLRNAIIRKHGRPISQFGFLLEELLPQLLKEVIGRYHLRAKLLL